MSHNDKPKLRVHVVGMPHVEFPRNEQELSEMGDPFTISVYRAANILKSHGHTVIMYDPRDYSATIEKKTDLELVWDRDSPAWVTFMHNLRDDLDKNRNEIQVILDDGRKKVLKNERSDDDVFMSPCWILSNFAYSIGFKVVMEMAYGVVRPCDSAVEKMPHLIVPNAMQLSAIMNRCTAGVANVTKLHSIVQLPLVQQDIQTVAKQDIIVVHCMTKEAMSGMHIAIAAFTHYVAQNPETKMRMVVNSPEFNTMTSTITYGDDETRQLMENRVFGSFLTGDKLSKAIAESAVLLYVPMRYEGHSMVVQNALANGVPVVMSNFTEFAAMASATCLVCAAELDAFSISAGIKSCLALDTNAIEIEKEKWCRVLSDEIHGKKLISVIESAIFWEKQFNVALDLEKGEGGLKEQVKQIVGVREQAAK